MQPSQEIRWAAQFNGVFEKGCDRLDHKVSVPTLTGDVELAVEFRLSRGRSCSIGAVKLSCPGISGARIDRALTAWQANEESFRGGPWNRGTLSWCIHVRPELSVKDEVEDEDEEDEDEEDEVEDVQVFDELIDIIITIPLGAAAATVKSMGDAMLTKSDGESPENGGGDLSLQLADGTITRVHSEVFRMLSEQILQVPVAEKWQFPDLTAQTVAVVKRWAYLDIVAAKEVRAIPIEDFENLIRFADLMNIPSFITRLYDSLVAHKNASLLANLPFVRVLLEMPSATLHEAQTRVTELVTTLTRARIRAAWNEGLSPKQLMKLADTIAEL